MSCTIAMLTNMHQDEMLEVLIKGLLCRRGVCRYADPNSDRDGPGRHPKRKKIFIKKHHFVCSAQRLEQKKDIILPV